MGSGRCRRGLMRRGWGRGLGRWGEGRIVRWGEGEGMRYLTKWRHVIGLDGRRTETGEVSQVLVLFDALICLA